MLLHVLRQAVNSSGMRVIRFARLPLRAVCFFAAIAFASGEDPAASLMRQAQSDLASGRYAAAIENATEAASLFQKTGDRSGEGRGVTTAGLAQLYSGDYVTALQSFTVALNIARQVHDAEAEITRLNNIGTVFYYLGRYADAMDRYQEALRRVEASPNQTWTASRRQLTIANTAILYQTLGQFERALDLYSELLGSSNVLPPREEAQLLANVGALRRRLGDPQKALETYRAAQALYKRAAHRDGEIAVLNNIGIVQAMNLNDDKGAAATFTAALDMARQSGDRPLEVHARLYRGEAFYRAGRMEQSAADFQIAADQATALGEVEEHWKALYGLGRIAIARGDTATADGQLRRALELIEKLRASLGGSSMRSDFLADKRDVYDLLIEHTTEPQEMFRLMEQSRARDLQDRVSPHAPKDLNAFARSLPADEAVLEYWMGPSAAAVLWISREATGMKRWALSSKDQDAINELPSILADSHRQDWREAASSASLAILPAIPALENPRVQRITIIPDGPLARVPFEALPLAGSGLMIERFTIAYSPSAALVAPAVKDRGVRWPWQKSLAAFADPEPGAGSNGVDIAAARAWPRLPEATREANGIANILGGRSSVHSGRDARKEFLDSASKAPLLHFATHAFSDLTDPERSYILLAPASRFQRFDYLFLKEVYGLRLAGVDLATISACQTNAGKLVRGEGVESFSRALLAAGARSVVTSLWNVGDKSTAELMLRFYRRLASGAPKAEALRGAKLEFLRYRPSSHPAYWAAFVLSGDGRSRIPYLVSWMWLAAFVAPIVCAAAVFALRNRAGKA